MISHPAGTVARFPDDGFIVRNGLDGYLAVPMRGAAGDVVASGCRSSTRTAAAGRPSR